MRGHDLLGRWMASLVLVSAFVSASRAEAGPITFNTALPVHANELILREQVIWLRATVALFGILPFLYKRMDVTTPSGQRVTRSASGFGDLSTFVRVTALQIDRPQETMRLAPFAGLKMPTGATGIADDLGQLPPALQLCGPLGRGWPGRPELALRRAGKQCRLARPRRNRRRRKPQFRKLELVSGARVAVGHVAHRARGCGADPSAQQNQRPGPRPGLHRAAERPGELLMARKPRLALAAVIVVALALVAILRGDDPVTEGPPIPSLVYLRAIGTEEGPGGLQQPVGVAVSPNAELFVTDSGNQRISVFDEKGTFLRAFGQEGHGPGELDRPMHLAFGPEGLLYVAEYINDRISVFRQDGTFVRHVKPKGVDAPSGVAVDAAGTVYVADFYNHRIVVLSPDGSERAWGHAGQGGLGELHYPTDVTVGPEGEVWVADAYNNRLQRFVAGESIQMITGITVANGVAVDGDGRVWAVDFEEGRVRAFDPNGAPLAVFGEPGASRAQLRHPTDVAVTADRVYVADFGNDRVQVWRMEEEVSAPWPAP